MGEDSTPARATALSLVAPLVVGLAFGVALQGCISPECDSAGCADLCTLGGYSGSVCTGGSCDCVGERIRDAGTDGAIDASPDTGEGGDGGERVGDDGGDPVGDDGGDRVGDDGGDRVGDDAGGGERSPIRSALTTDCDATVADVYAFEVSLGQRVVARADTVRVETASDLALEIYDQPRGGTLFSEGDDDIECSFPPPEGGLFPNPTPCPETTFVMLSEPPTGMFYAVIFAWGRCADEWRQEYELSVTIDGEPALLWLVEDEGMTDGIRW